MVNKHLRTAQGYTFKMMKDMDKAIAAWNLGKTRRRDVETRTSDLDECVSSNESTLDENVERVISYTERNLELLTDMKDYLCYGDARHCTCIKDM